MRKLSRATTFIALASALALNACGTKSSSTSETQAVDSKGGWILNTGDKAGNQVFNLAKFSKENGSLKGSLGKYSESGNMDLGFGDKKSFKAEMNLTVQSFGDNSAAAGDRQIAAGYWLDTYAFNQKIAGSKDRGMTFDVGALGHLDNAKIDVAVRFAGHDIYRNAVFNGAAYDNSFTRDFNYSAVYYPVPLLGLKVDGKVGGELGIHVQGGVRRDNALDVNFVPRIAANGALNTGITLLNFASAEVQGIAKLAEAQFSSSANIGLMPSANMGYGSIGIDGGKFTALDGKIDIVAKAGLGSVLPKGVSKALWSFVFGNSGSGDWEWRHTVYQPKKPLYVADIPRLGADFISFYKKPKDKNECKSKQSEAYKELDSRVATLTSYKDSVSDMPRIATEAAIAYMGDARTKLDKICN